LWIVKLRIFLLTDIKAERPPPRHRGNGLSESSLLGSIDGSDKHTPTNKSGRRRRSALSKKLKEAEQPREQKKEAARRCAAIVRASARAIAKGRRVDGVVVEIEQWAPIMAAILYMASAGTYPTNKGRRTWGGPKPYVLFRELQVIGFDELDWSDHAIRHTLNCYVDEACKKYRKRNVTPAQLGRMIGLTSDEREEHKAWPILPCDETANQRNDRMKKIRETARRRAKGAKPRSEWLMSNSDSQTEPWKTEGVSRATRYRREENKPQPIDYRVSLADEIERLADQDFSGDPRDFAGLLDKLELEHEKAA
jgi:hypothetical protein